MAVTDRDDSERFLKMSKLGRIGWWEGDFLHKPFCVRNMSANCWNWRAR